MRVRPVRALPFRPSPETLSGTEEVAGEEKNRRPRFPTPELRADLGCRGPRINSQLGDRDPVPRPDDTRGPRRAARPRPGPPLRPPRRLCPPVPQTRPTLYSAPPVAPDPPPPSTRTPSPPYRRAVRRRLAWCAPRWPRPSGPPAPGRDWTKGRPAAPHAAPARPRPARPRTGPAPQGPRPDSEGVCSPWARAPAAAGETAPEPGPTVLARPERPVQDPPPGRVASRPARPPALPSLARPGSTPCSAPGSAPGSAPDSARPLARACRPSCAAGSRPAPGPEGSGRGRADTPECPAPQGRLRPVSAPPTPGGPRGPVRPGAAAPPPGPDAVRPSSAGQRCAGRLPRRSDPWAQGRGRGRAGTGGGLSRLSLPRRGRGRPGPAEGGPDQRGGRQGGRQKEEEGREE